MLKSLISAVLILSVCMGRSHAADLWDMYRLALLNDAAYQAATLNHESNVINLPLAKTAFGPAVSASGTMGHQRSDITGSTQSGENNLINLDLNLPLYNKSSRINIQQAGYQVRISELQLQDAKHDLMLRVAERYFNLLASQDAREVARLQKITIQRQMDLARERLDVGLGTRTDLFDAKARFLQAQADEIQAENLINNSAAALREIIGSTPQSILPLSEGAPLELPSPNDVQSWIEKSVTNNVPLMIQSINLEIANSEIEKQRQVRSPVVDFNANHRWNDSQASPSGDNSTTSIGLTLSFPIYQRGTINLQTEQAAVRYNLAKQLYEQARRQISTVTTSEFLGINSRVSQVNALSEAIVAGENALEAKEEGFSAGLTTNLDVLDAQRDLSRSKTDYLQARYNYILSVLRLERASGQLDEDDIRRVNSWLNGPPKPTTAFKMNPSFIDEIPPVFEFQTVVSQL